MCNVLYIAHFSSSVRCAPQHCNLIKTQTRSWHISHQAARRASDINLAYGIESHASAAAQPLRAGAENKARVRYGFFSSVYQYVSTGAAFACVQRQHTSHVGYTFSRAIRVQRINSYVYDFEMNNGPLTGRARFADVLPDRLSRCARADWAIYMRRART